MLSLAERIHLLEEDLKHEPPRVAISSDMPFAIFRYDPRRSDEREWIVRQEIRRLVTRVENATGRKVRTTSLARLFWRSIEESEGLDALVELEQTMGFAEAQRQVQAYLADPAWRSLPDLMEEEIRGLDDDRSIVFLTDASVFAPGAYRVSALLDQMSGRVRVPVVLFFPGIWSGSLNYLALHGDDHPPSNYLVKIYGRDS